MQRKYLVLGVFYIATFAAGFMIGKTSAAKRFEEDYQGQREYFLNKLNEKNTEVKENKIVETTDSEPIIPSEEVIKSIEKEQDTRSHVFAGSVPEEVKGSWTDYQGRSTPPSAVNVTPVVVDDSKINVIGESDYNLNVDDYVQTHLTYYIPDNVLAETDSDEIYVDVRVHVGDQLLLFAAMRADEDTIYVSNDILETHYEIKRSMASYREVAGLPEEWENESERDTP